MQLIVIPKESCLLRRRTDLSRQISGRYPIVVGSPGSCEGVKSLRTGGEIPTRGVKASGYRAFVKSGVMRSRKLGHFKSRNSGNDLDRPFEETRGRDRMTRRYIGYWGFGLTEDFHHRSIENSETARGNQDRPFLGCVAVIGAIGKRSRQEVIHQAIGSQEIVDPADEWSL
jgi:hypothetical protein